MVVQPTAAQLLVDDLPGVAEETPERLDQPRIGIGRHSSQGTRWAVAVELGISEVPVKMVCETEPVGAWAIEG